MTSFANQMAIALQNSRLYGQLETSERHYRGLVENAHEGIWIVEIDGTIKFANRRMEEITGEADLAGKNLADFWDPENYRKVEAILQQNQAGQVVQQELEIICPGPRPGGGDHELRAPDGKWPAPGHVRHVQRHQ